MNSLFTTSLFSLGLLVFVFACSNMDNDTLATIDGKAVALEDFTSKNPASRFANKEKDFLDSKVDEFVRKALFTRVAIDRGFGETDDVLIKRKKTENRQLLQEVYTKVILDAVVGDEYIKEIYDRSGTELNARHILVQFKGTSRSRSERTRVDALAIMGQINNRLSKGESFEALAGEFTDDPSGKENGGDLGWFGWGKMVGPFQDAAFKLNPGEVSNVVETDFGFHIIKLEAKREVERGDFESEKNALKQQASREKSAELGQKANEFLDGQKKAAGFEVLTENVHEFFMIYDGSGLKKEPMDEMLKKLNYQTPLFKLRGEELGSDWLAEEIGMIDEGQKPRFNGENQLLGIIDQLVTQNLIISYGHDNKYDQDKVFAKRINALVERFAYEAFIAKEINENLTPSDDELLAFYEANKAEKYMDKKKVLVREIFVKDSLFAASLKKRLDAGELMEKLAERYTERKATKAEGGLLPAFQEGRYGVMGKEAFTMAVGEIAGPITLGNGYSIIQLEETIPEGPKPFVKVKGRVRTEILSELRESRNEKLYSELQKEFPVKVNYSAVHAFYDDMAVTK
ncbi:MAG: peptidylprolyl isomerase [Candidatus Marinimicrobia bacterium]|nr:peptidylprolyl isomerase [Candidatus Neomarinimicrobiota bacterium]